jgi:hypothetical protein
MIKSEMGDLYSTWLGTRELLLRGRNPYGPDVTHEIQMAFYGRNIDQTFDRPGALVIDEQRFAYPVYVVFLLAPAMHLNFANVQTWAPLIFATLTAFSVLAWLNILRWRPPRTVVAAIILFVLSSPQIVQGLRLRQLGLLAAFLLTMSAYAISRNRLAAAGVFLALATLKPQMALLPISWFLLWGVSACRTRWRLLAGFGITLTVLVAAGEIVLPGWPYDFFYGMLAYRKYVTRPSLLVSALGNDVGTILSAIAILVILALAWRTRYADAAKPEFIHTLAASFICATLALPLLVPFNQVLLLLPVMIILCKWAALPRIQRGIFAMIAAWPSVCSLFFLLHRPPINSLSQLPLLPNVSAFLLPFSVLLLFSTSELRKELRLPPKDSSAVRP